MLTEADRKVLNEIYRSSKNGMNAIHSVIGKVYDDDLALDLNRQAYHYAKLSEKAANKLYTSGWKPEDASPIDKAIRWGSIQMNTLTDISTEHIAEMVIQESTKGMTSVMKAVKENKAGSKFCMEVANELTNFEEKNIRRLKSYL